MLKSEPTSIMLNGESHKVVKVIYQPRKFKHVLYLDNGILIHAECRTVLASAGSNPSGTKNCQKYKCSKCGSSYTDVDKEFVPKNKKYVVSNMQIASDKT